MGERKSEMQKRDDALAFISYSSLNRGFVSTLYENLMLIGVKGWIDLIEMPRADTPFEEHELNAALRSAMDSCDLAIVVLSDYALTSKWVQYEIAYAIESSRRRPGFKLIPLLDERMKSPLPEWIECLDPIDFSRGYNTALAQLLQRTGIASSQSPSWLAGSISQSRSFASRTSDSGTSFSDHVRATISDSQLASYVAYLGPECARVEHHESADDVLVNLTGWANTWLEESCVVNGNEQKAFNDNRVRMRAILSTIPAPWANPDRSVLALVSFYRPETSYDNEPDCTLGAEYRTDGSGNLWLAYKGHIHHYTLGNSQHLPRLLMERRKMGAEPYVFIWPIKNPPSHELWLLQAMHNKAGRGSLVAPFRSVFAEQMQGTRGMVRSVLERAATLNWVTPVTRQEESLIAHLTHGGIFCYEIFPAGGISLMLARQIKHVLTCAGALVIDESGSDTAWETRRQWVSLSTLQKDLLVNT
jgi:hypothetical protein